VSVRVHFSPGFPLGGGFSRRAICFAVVVREDCRRREEVALAGNSTKWGSSCGILMLVGGGCSAENCSGSIRNSAEKGISRGANCQVFALVVFEIRRAPHVFLYLFAHFPVVMARVATVLIYLTKKPPNLLPVFYFLQSKIEYPQSKNCSSGIPPPFVNLVLKRTWTDAILK
jgi:hypothetical protein